MDEYRIEQEDGQTAIWDAENKVGLIMAENDKYHVSVVLRDAELMSTKEGRQEAARIEKAIKEYAKDHYPDQYGEA